MSKSTASIERARFLEKGEEGDSVRSAAIKAVVEQYSFAVEI